MQLNYKLTINDKLQNISIVNRILAFELVEHTDLQLDTLLLTLNNSDAKLELPKKEATLELAIGFSSTVSMGKYVAQFVENNNSTITIKGVSQDLTVARIKHNRLFEQKSLKDVLETLSSSLGLKLQLDNTLQTKQIPYLLQQEQSDLSLLQELGELFYSVATIKDNNLIFIPKDKQDTKAKITLQDSELLDIKRLDTKYKTYSGVKTSFWNTKTATKEEIKLGEEPYLYIPSIYGLELTKELIKSKYKQIQEKELLELKTIGNPNLQAGITLELKPNTKIYQDFKGIYKITKAKHSFTAGVYSCQINAYKM